MDSSITDIKKSHELYLLVRDTLEMVQAPAASSFLSDLPLINELKICAIPTEMPPIVSELANLGRTVPATSRLVKAVLKTATTQPWRQPYTVEDFGYDFAMRSAWFPIADRGGPIVMNDGLVEIMLLDSNLKYPRHSHSPEELYVVLAGDVWWEAEGDPGASSWCHAGEVIHHPSNRRHALTAGDNPALLLALWRGGGFEKPTINKNNAAFE